MVAALGLPLLNHLLRKDLSVGLATSDEDEESEKAERGPIE